MNEVAGRWIPKDYTLLDWKHDAVVYGQTHPSGKFYAIGYHGKAMKHDFYFAFRTAEHRAKYIAEYFDGRRMRAETMEKRKADRKGGHSLKVGDILKCSWGYDQTNIDYYQVTRVVGANTVEIREIGQEAWETRSMVGDCKPVKDSFTGEPMIKRASKDNTIRMTSYSWAHRIEPNEVGHWTAYA